MQAAVALRPLSAVRVEHWIVIPRVVQVDTPPKAGRQAPAKRAVVAILTLAALGYAGACGYLWLQQRALIYQPDVVTGRTPRDVGLEFQALDIGIPGGGTIHAWWLPPKEAASEAASAGVLYLHGNDGNLGRELDRLQVLQRLGVPILAIDYRGYGRSSGPPPSESRLYEDATAAWDYLVYRMGVGAGRVVLYGHSLGGAVAAELALRRPASCAVVLDSTFTTMSEMGRREYPWMPIDWLLSERFETQSKLGRLSLPILLVHGGRDGLAPVAMMERLYRAAQEPKQQIVVTGAGHENALQAGGEELLMAITQLVHGCGRTR